MPAFQSAAFINDVFMPATLLRTTSGSGLDSGYRQWSEFMTEWMTRPVDSDALAMASASAWSADRLHLDAVESHGAGQREPVLPRQLLREHRDEHRALDVDRGRHLARLDVTRGIEPGGQRHGGSGLQHVATRQCGHAADITAGADWVLRNPPYRCFRVLPCRDLRLRRADHRQRDVHFRHLVRDLPGSRRRVDDGPVAARAGHAQRVRPLCRAAAADWRPVVARRRGCRACATSTGAGARTSRSGQACWTGCRRRRRCGLPAAVASSSSLEWVGPVADPSRPAASGAARCARETTSRASSRRRTCFCWPPSGSASRPRTAWSSRTRPTALAAAHAAGMWAVAVPSPLTRSLEFPAPHVTLESLAARTLAELQQDLARRTRST